MATRPRQHQLDAQGKAALSTRFNEFNWVAEEQTQDYGLDYDVKPFVDGEMTRYHFYVQLKSSDDSSDKREIKTERLRSYIEYASPVMIVGYDAFTGSLRYVWAHELAAAFSPDDLIRLHTQKTMTVTLLHDLTVLRQRTMLAEVVNELSRRGKARTRGEVVELALLLAPPLEPIRESLLNSLTAASGRALVRVVTSSDRLELRLPGDSANVAVRFGDQERDWSVPPCWVPDNGDYLIIVSQFFIALALAVAGACDIALDLLEALFDSADWTIPGVLDDCVALTLVSHLPELFIAEGRTGDAIRIANRLRDRGALPLAQILASTALLGEGRVRYALDYREFHERAIATTDDPTIRATLAYSLANSLRSNELFYPALREYRTAAKLDPDYLNRGYWHAEVGGCLALAGRLSCAERAYVRAVELGAWHPPAHLGLADVRAKTGRYGLAADTLQELLEREEQPLPQAALASVAYQSINTLFGDGNRTPDASAQLFESVMSQEVSHDEAQAACLEALRLDPLNAEAWLNYGYTLAGTNDAAPMEAFLCAAMLAPGSADAWACLILLLQALDDTTDERLLLPLVLSYALESVGQKLHTAIVLNAVNFGLSEDEARVHADALLDLAQTSSDLFPSNMPVLARFFDSSNDEKSE